MGFNSGFKGLTTTHSTLVKKPIVVEVNVKSKVRSCTGTEALYRPYRPKGE